MGLFGKAKQSSGSISSTKSVAKSVKLTKDASGAAKVSIEKINATGSVSLSKSAAASAVSLHKQGLAGIRGRAVVVLDHSGSMRDDYQSGAVQALTEKALAYGLQFASTEQVTLIPFDSVVKREVNVDLSNYHDVVNQHVYDRAHMGNTNLTDALKMVKKIAEGTDELIFCTVITDGNPNDKRSCSQVVCELAGYPVFIKFLALGNVSYLQELDDLGDDVRLLDNVDSKFFPNITSITDESFAEAMADEWKSWIDLATSAGVLTQ